MSPTLKAPASITRRLAFPTRSCCRERALSLLKIPTIATFKREKESLIAFHRPIALICSVAAPIPLFIVSYNCFVALEIAPLKVKPPLLAISTSRSTEVATLCPNDRIFSATPLNPLLIKLSPRISLKKLPVLFKTPTARAAAPRIVFDRGLPRMYAASLRFNANAV